MANTNYILLIRKADFIDFFKNGKMNGSLCASEKFDGDIDKLSNDTKTASKVFAKANAFDYSIEYILMHVNTSYLSKLKIDDVQGIYALDSDAYSIGLDTNPRITLGEPIWQPYYVNYQILQSISKAHEGAGLLLDLFGWSKIPAIKKFTKKDIQEVFRELYFEERPKGDLTIWPYLLRYERHEAYPKDSRGFVLDTLHVYGNYCKKVEIDKSVANTKRGMMVLDNTCVKINDIIEQVFDKDFIKTMKKKKVDETYLKIASLYLFLKSVFINGISDEELYFKMPLDKFIAYLKEKNEEEILMPAVYLLGLSLGRDSLYKYMYKRDGIKILA